MPNDPAAACPAHCPAACGHNDMVCNGGMDANGCEMPATCMPSDPESLCPVICPVTCGATDLMCGGGPDPWSGNGCAMPMYCMPNTIANCPAHCPVTCGMNEMYCYGGMDANGCEMPATCVPANPMTSSVGEGQILIPPTDALCPCIVCQVNKVAQIQHRNRCHLRTEERTIMKTTAKDAIKIILLYTNFYPNQID